MAAALSRASGFAGSKGELREDFESLRLTMTRLRPQGGESAVAATVRKMSMGEADACAARIVALGDSFHRSDSAANLPRDDLATLLMLQRGREWFWICGNHDPHLPASIGGTVCATLTIRGVTLRHEPSPAPSPRGA